MPDRLSVEPIDDDIEFIYSNNTGSLTCQLCLDSLDHLTVREREGHYAMHFAGEESTTPSSSKPSPSKPQRTPSKVKFSAKAVSKVASRSLKTLKAVVPYIYKPEEDNFWYALNTSDPPPNNFTPNLIPLLKKSLSKMHPYITARAVLCNEAITFIGQEKFDKWWGCGYRNFLMTCTALICQQKQPEYFSLLDNPNTPLGLRKLQRTIEAAWADGYDPEGAKHYSKRLYGTSEWIGTADLYVALTFKGIPARLVDFPASHGRSRAAERVSRWIINYFSPEAVDKTLQPAPKSAFDALTATNRVIQTDRMPVILQYKGHSRTIVGYEILRNGKMNLLVFDPARQLPEELRQLALDSRKEQLQPSTTGASNKLHPSTSMTREETMLENSHQASKRRRSDTSFGKNTPEVVVIEDDEVEHRGVPTKTPKRLRGSAVGTQDIDVIDEDKRNKAGHKDSRKTSLGDALKWKSALHGAATSQPKATRLDTAKILSLFRISTESLRRHDQYQLLWFPLSEPLSDTQRRDRKLVTSDRFD